MIPGLFAQVSFFGGRKGEGGKKGRGIGYGLLQ
jgi:hypothetical protein